MLGGYRVLDLSDERGQLAGAMLCNLGAEVILVEPPGGARSRTLGPWAGGHSGIERSLTHWGYNRGKKSVVLDLTARHPDRATFLDLVRGADVLIESATPGDMAAHGLGYEDLASMNPGLVYVSISAFGQQGPKARWASTDLTVWAASMVHLITGDADRAPVRLPVPQAFLHASGEAAGGALLALLERARSGRGQHVDISAQQASFQATQSGVLCAAYGSIEPTRLTAGVKLGPLDLRLAWPCKDGYASITFLFGPMIGPMTRRLMEWIHEEGFCDEATLNKNWIEYGMLLATEQEPMSEYERIKGVVAAFVATKTKAELLEASLERRVLVAPAATCEDVACESHFDERAYWDEVDDPLLTDRPIRAPGRMAIASVTPLPRLGRAPWLGEDNGRIEARPSPRVVEAPASGKNSVLPLEGLKVLDLMWVMAGPAITRVAADYGATVVRVESVTRPDAIRGGGPWLGGVFDSERSGTYHNLNAGKLGIALNLMKPEARGVVLDLVRWADVVTESFSPKALKAWALSYEDLRAVNPSLIMLSSCLMGQTGSLASFAGFGNLAAAITGFYDMVGWPDRDPAGQVGAYTDYVSPRFGLAALLAAIDHRRRTGEGQHIDLSQAEASLHFLTPAILDYTVNGVVWGRRGNDDLDMSPHGVYPCAGDDQWVAIGCRCEDDRVALSKLIGQGDLSDGVIAKWTTTLAPDEVAAACQEGGVPAHALYNSADCWADPQLKERGHFVEVEHNEFGPLVVENSRIKLSRTPARVERPGPVSGEHTSMVLSEFLGYDDERIGDLYAAEALE